MKCLFIFLMLAFLLTGCAMQLSEPEELSISPKTPSENKPAEGNQMPGEAGSGKAGLSCEEWAASMLPYIWVFSQDATQDPKLTREVISLRQGTWQDGSMIKGLSSTKVELGSKPGENTNYYYSRAIYLGMNQTQHGFTYSERAMNKDGVVLGYNTFKIQPVFRATYDTTLDEKDISNITIKVRYLGLAIVEPNIILCEKVD